jgi:two-component system chemotaxis response regulator CheB
MTQVPAAAPRKIRVLVVEDSASVRARLCEVLSSDTRFDVVGAADTGASAIEMCDALRPDVMTVDLMLPGMGGLQVTEQVMSRCPTPILIVASTAHRSERFQAYEALAAGAVDLLEKPRAYEFEGVWEWQLRSALITVSRARVSAQPRARLGAFGRGLSGALPKQPEQGLATRPVRALAIAASSIGGPAALVEVLQALPASFAVPVLVVLHFAEPFAQGFAEWLDGQSTRRVTCAIDREPLAAIGGRVTLAPAGRHLSLSGGRLRLSEEPERNGCRPSADALFESLARELGSEVAACVLSGIGQDGAAGLLDVRKAGGQTFAQEEAGAVARELPHEAARLEAAQRILPLHELGAALARLETPEDSVAGE